MSDTEIDPETLNLENLREITGGDKEFETVLFSTYLETSRDNFAALEKLCFDGESREWEEHAHAMKGESANLGAAKLASLCQRAQKAFTASKVEKEEILAAIRTEWQIVYHYLEKMLAG